MVIESAVTPGSVPAALVPSAGPHGDAMSPKSEEPVATVVFEPLLPPLSPESLRPLPHAVATRLSTATTATMVAPTRAGRRDRVALGACAGWIWSPLGTVVFPLVVAAGVATGVSSSGRPTG